MGEVSFREVTQVANGTCTIESLARSFIVLKSGNQINIYLAVLYHHFDIPGGRGYCCRDLFVVIEVMLMKAMGIMGEDVYIFQT